MMRLVDLRGQRLSKAGYTNMIPRAALDVAEAMKLETLITSSPSLSADLKSILGPNCLQG